jgi:hypothetical protein
MGKHDLREIRKHLENADDELHEAQKVAERVGDKKGAGKIKEAKEFVKKTARDGFGSDSL